MELWIIGGVFALIGGGAVRLALFFFKKDRLIGKWPKVPATIVSSDVRKQGYAAGGQHGSQSSYSLLFPHVSYTYSVDGSQYTGDKVAREVAATNSRRAVQRCLDRYVPGNEVMAFVNPADPNVAYLETRRSIGGIVMSIFGGISLLLGIVILLVAGAQGP